MRNIWRAINAPVKDALLAIWLGNAILLGLIVVMWVFNVIGMKGINIPITVLGTLIIAFVGFRSNLLMQVGLLGAIISLLEDKDKSQGVTTGLLWLIRAIVVLAYAFVFAGFTLLTWSFEANPAGFWVIMLGIGLVLLLNEVYGRKSSWAPNVVTAFVILVVIVNVWATFGSPYAGKAFNPHTGEPKVMVDLVTNKIDALKRTPAECRPEGTQHEGFPYHERGLCFSAETGMRLVPITPESAMLRNPTSWVGLAWKKLKEWFEESPWIWVVPVVIILLLLSTFLKRRATSGGIHPSTAMLIAIVGAIGIVLAVSWMEERGQTPPGSCVKLEDVASKQLYVSDPGHFILGVLRRYFYETWLGRPPQPDYTDMTDGGTRCFSIGKDSQRPVVLNHLPSQGVVCRLADHQPGINSLFMEGLTIHHLVLVDNFTPGVSRIWPKTEEESWPFHVRSTQAKRGMDVNKARMEFECNPSPP